MTSKIRNWNAYEIQRTQAAAAAAARGTRCACEPSEMNALWFNWERDSQWQFVASHRERFACALHRGGFTSTAFSHWILSSHEVEAHNNNMILYNTTASPGRRVVCTNVKSTNTVVTHNNSCAAHRFRLPICTTFSPIFTRSFHLFSVHCSQDLVWIYYRESFAHWKWSQIISEWLKRFQYAFSKICFCIQSFWPSESNFAS